LLLKSTARVSENNGKRFLKVGARVLEWEQQRVAVSFACWSTNNSALLLKLAARMSESMQQRIASNGSYSYVGM
jgi:hypothetical protein